MQKSDILSALKKYDHNKSFFRVLDSAAVATLRKLTRSLGDPKSDRDLTWDETLQFCRIILDYNKKHGITVLTPKDTLFADLSTIFDKRSDEHAPLAFSHLSIAYFLDQASLLNEYTLTVSLALDDSASFANGIRILSLEKALDETSFKILAAKAEQAEPLADGLRVLYHSHYIPFAEPYNIGMHEPGTHLDSRQVTPRHLDLLTQYPENAVIIAQKILPLWYNQLEKPGVASNKLDKLCEAARLFRDDLRGMQIALTRITDPVETVAIIERLYAQVAVCNAPEFIAALSRVPDYLCYTVPALLYDIVDICHNNAAEPVNAVVRYLNVLAGYRPPAEHLPATARPAAFNPNQSTHTESVHHSVSDSAKRLKARYGNKIHTEKQLNTVIKKIRKWATNLSSTELQSAAAKRAIAYLTDPSYAFTDPASEVSTLQLLALMWEALQDESARTCAWNDAEKRLITALYDFERGYNLDANFNEVDINSRDIHICTGGTFNKIMEIGWGIHPDVALLYITHETAHAKFVCLIREEAIKRLKSMRETCQSNEEEQRFYDVIKQIKEEGVEPIWEAILPIVSEKMWDEFSPLYKNKSSSQYTNLLLTGPGVLLEGRQLFFMPTLPDLKSPDLDNPNKHALSIAADREKYNDAYIFTPSNLTYVNQSGFLEDQKIKTEDKFRYDQLLQSISAKNLDQATLLQVALRNKPAQLAFLWKIIKLNEGHENVATLELDVIFKRLSKNEVDEALEEKPVSKKERVPDQASSSQSHAAFFNHRTVQQISASTNIKPTTHLNRKKAGIQP